MKLRNLPSKYRESRSPGRTLSRPTAQARGYDYKWQRARIAHLQANPFCVHCQPLFVAATVVDHIIPHRNDMKLFWDRKNWQSLCATCHNSWKQQQEQML